jgi:hypothetical protein
MVAILKVAGGKPIEPSHVDQVRTGRSHRSPEMIKEIVVGGHRGGHEDDLRVMGHSAEEARESVVRDVVSNWLVTCRSTRGPIDVGGEGLVAGEGRENPRLHSGRGPSSKAIHTSRVCGAFIAYFATSPIQ